MESVLQCGINQYCSVGLINTAVLDQYCSVGSINTAAWNQYCSVESVLHTVMDRCPTFVSSHCHSVRILWNFSCKSAFVAQVRGLTVGAYIALVWGLGPRKTQSCD